MNEHARRELEPPATVLRRGSFGPDVKRLQEWLCLHGFHTAVDGDFGSATEEALRQFQRHMVEEDVVGREEWITGAVDGRTWATLTEPMRRVVEWERDPPLSPKAEIVACAYAHLGARAREVGGPNSGPWVRLYMDGHEGKDWPWCAGFATYVLRQALGHDKWRTFSCDELAAKAKERGQFISASNSHTRQNIKPGHLFLIRSPGLSMGDWLHCGIVTAVGTEHFETIEGNTYLPSARGGVDARRDRNGESVEKRVRAFKPNVDFVLTGETT